MRQQRMAWGVIVGVLWLAAGTRAQVEITAADIAPFVADWTLDLTKSGTTDVERRVITVGARWMRIEIHRPADDRPPVLIYNLDGSKNVNPFGSGTATTELRREPNGLMTVTAFTVNERSVTVQERLHLTSGGELAVAVVLRVEHGYQGVGPAFGAQAPNAAETSKVFRKTEVKS